MIDTADSILELPNIRRPESTRHFYSNDNQGYNSNHVPVGVSRFLFLSLESRPPISRSLSTPLYCAETPSGRRLHWAARAPVHQTIAKRATDSCKSSQVSKTHNKA